MPRERQPPAATVSRADRKRLEARIAAIDAANAERSRHLTPTRKYDWEVERERRGADAAKIRGLEAALATALAEVVSQRAVVKALRARKNVLLRDEVLAAVGRAPLLPRELLPKVEASYGSVGKDAMREVMRVLAELKESGLIKRVPGGYVRR